MLTETNTVLVTGGAGYIGSHAVLALQQVGYQPIVLDNLSSGNRDVVEDILKANLIVGDINDKPLLKQIFSSYNFTAILHFAASIDVGESVLYPEKYYQNNFSGSLNLLEAALSAKVKNFIFSSTSAIYGNPNRIPIYEEDTPNPISPYARSKLMVEQFLADFNISHKLKSVCFRYFNAAGADPSGLIGEDRPSETHLIPLLLLTAMKKRDSISLFGTDYETHDGTCIRDYIHVSDIASAHVLGMEYLMQGGESQIFNLGNGNGFSVREIVEAAKYVTQQEIFVYETQRRSGDTPILVGSSTKAQQILGWNPKYVNIEQIIAHAWNWHQKRFDSQRKP
jgi:UDP-glucose 4-epimerase